MAKKILSKKESKSRSRQLLASKAGRVQLASELVNPLIELQLYKSVARRAFNVDTLDIGELPVYDKDEDVTAFVLAENGESFTQIAKGKNVTLPMVEIDALVEIPKIMIRSRKYDVVERLKTKSEAEIFAVEDTYLFNLLINACIDENIITSTVAGLDETKLSDAMSVIEERGNEVGAIFLNPAHKKIFRMMAKEFFTPSSNEEILKKGTLGYIYGAEVHISRVCPKDRIIVTSSKDTLGVLSEGYQLDVEDFSDTKTRSIGLSAFEQIGAFVFGGNVAVIEIG